MYGNKIFLIEFDDCRLYYYFLVREFEKFKNFFWVCDIYFGVYGSLLEMICNFGWDSGDVFVLIFCFLVLICIMEICFFLNVFNILLVVGMYKFELRLCIVNL